MLQPSFYQWTVTIKYKYSSFIFSSNWPLIDTASVSVLGLGINICQIMAKLQQTEVKNHILTTSSSETQLHFININKG